MKIYVCIKEYTYYDNDGNGEYLVKVLEGSMFFVQDIWNLPNNYNHQYDYYFTVHKI